MKRIHRESIRIVAALLIVIVAFCIQGGCQNGTPPPISDTLITASVSAGTSAGLKLAISDAAKRKVIAQYLNTYGAALRTITGNPTDEQLTAQLQAFIPPDINTQYPELGSFAIPLVVSAYDWAKAKYGTDAKVEVQILNDIGNGLNIGSACCLQ